HMRPTTEPWPALMRSLGALVRELVQGLHYLAVVPTLLGLWWFGRLAARRRGLWIMIAYFVLHALILVALGLKVYYVSDRHVMMLIMPLTFFLAAGLLEMGDRLAQWVQIRFQRAVP